MRKHYLILGFLLCSMRWATPSFAQFDSGKMWTFEYAPAKYFSETYKFDANPQWFERARMSALRIPGCSASFVSPNGLMVTNHHCARGSVVQVSKAGEDLLENGFFATALAEERRIAGYYADQLIAVTDVSDEIFSGKSTAAQVQQRFKQQYGANGDSIVVEMVKLFAGGRHSAYVFRRLTDIRLVGAAELQAGFFGGDWDNFTYPRYDLDFAFLRAYGKDGKPLTSPNYFKWSKNGVQENDVVFVIGNPGPTTRMNSVAQLEFIRDVQLPVQIQNLQARWDVLNAALRADPKSPNASAIRNQMFGLSNTLKAAGGRLTALHDSAIMAKRIDAEQKFLASVRANPTLTQNYGDVITHLQDVQKRKRALAPMFTRSFNFGAANTTPAVLRRAAVRYLRGDTAKTSDITDNLAVIERGYLEAQLKEMGTKVTADDIQKNPASTSALMQEFMPGYQAFATEWQKLIVEEAEWNAKLGRARFEIYGTSVAPDATFSLRITDGLVLPYQFNGTIAPVYTTFYGMYDRYYSHGPGTDWDLPKRWVPKPAELNLGTPLNFISTADTYGGNSGSPAVTRNLEIVGLNFDRNVNGLSRDYVYLPEKGRNVMVDVRAIAEALRAVYKAPYILNEILSN